jgi:SAM-dependent methyltransferase
MESPRYDSLGTTYTATRREDAVVARQIHDALGIGRTLLNVGAGAGAYEPHDRIVLAVEPSRVMIAQRSSESAPAIVGTAEKLPFLDRSFDAAMALHTVHHWSDTAAGLRELRRVARRVVILTGDAEVMDRLWLAGDYFPGFAFGARAEVQPSAIAAQLGGRTQVRPLRVPARCVDGFTEAFIGRPEAYLDPTVRRNMSPFRLLPEHQVEEGVARLRRDLASGAWDERYGSLRLQTELDIGLRLVISDPD